MARYDEEAPRYPNHCFCSGCGTIIAKAGQLEFEKRRLCGACACVNTSAPYMHEARVPYTPSLKEPSPSTSFQEDRRNALTKKESFRRHTMIHSSNNFTGNLMSQDFHHVHMRPQRRNRSDTLMGTDDVGDNPLYNMHPERRYHKEALPRIMTVDYQQSNQHRDYPRRVQPQYCNSNSTAPIRRIQGPRHTTVDLMHGKIKNDAHSSSEQIAHSTAPRVFDSNLHHGRSRPQTISRCQRRSSGPNEGRISLQQIEQERIFILCRSMKEIGEDGGGMDQSKGDVMPTRQRRSMPPLLPFSEDTPGLDHAVNASAGWRVMHSAHAVKPQERVGISRGNNIDMPVDNLNTPMKIQKIKIVKKKPSGEKDPGGSSKSSIKSLVKKKFGFGSSNSSDKTKLTLNAWEADEVSVLGMEGW